MRPSSYRGRDGAEQKIARAHGRLAPAFKGWGRQLLRHRDTLLGWLVWAPKTYTGKLRRSLSSTRAESHSEVFRQSSRSRGIRSSTWRSKNTKTASKRVTAGRALALGVFALAAKKTTKSAVLIARLRSGEEAIFQTEKFTAAELRAKLAPITSQLRKANASSSPTALLATSSPFFTAPSSNGSPAAAVSVADELKKLAELKDAELLTDEEFAGQKAKLLAPSKRSVISSVVKVLSATW